MLPRLLREPECRRLRLYEQKQRQAEAQEPAQVSKSPAVSRDFSNVFVRRDLGEISIVEHLRDFDGNVGSSEDHQRQQKVLDIYKQNYPSYEPSSLGNSLTEQSNISDDIQN